CAGWPYCGERSVARASSASAVGMPEYLKTAMTAPVPGDRSQSRAARNGQLSVPCGAIPAADVHRQDRKDRQGYPLSLAVFAVLAVELLEAGGLEGFGDRRPGREAAEHRIEQEERL